jgi:hypothetical protein
MFKLPYTRVHAYSQIQVFNGTIIILVAALFHEKFSRKFKLYFCVLSFIYQIMVHLEKDILGLSNDLFNADFIIILGGKYPTK